MTLGVRRGLGMLLLSVVLFAVGWILTYGTSLGEELGVGVLMLAMLGVLVSLVWIAVALLRRPKQTA